MLRSLRKGSAAIAPAVEREADASAVEHALPPVEQTTSKTYWGRRIPVIGMSNNIILKAWLNGADARYAHSLWSGTFR